ncbi:hypothetical protein N7530_005613 [Penicillium desertorum]|uniref:Uncharacterized protein n=1 Tax=Penicillium desertorum TaxID=1303715 RepID=A0A9W9X0G8_9EURO|nr:hypothetical protein N7530_005613 [Penicillium desertorum]
MGTAHIYNPDIFAIAEVKPKVRNRPARMDGCPMGVDNPDIFAIAKEIAEMVSWIPHDDEEARETPDHQRLLVSQDNHEIWLTLATYDARYV